jgi:hypothetical protein
MNVLDGKKGLCPCLKRTYLSASGFAGGKGGPSTANPAGKKSFYRIVRLRIMMQHILVCLYLHTCVLFTATHALVL